MELYGKEINEPKDKIEVAKSMKTLNLLDSNNASCSYSSHRFLKKHKGPVDDKEFGFSRKISRILTRNPYSRLRLMAVSSSSISYHTSDSSSSSSDSSSSRHRSRHRNRRDRVRDRNKESLKIRKKSSKSHSKRRRKHRHHSSDSYDSSDDCYSSRGESSSDSDHETSNHSKRHKKNDKPKKSKEKERSKGHRHKHKKHKVKEKQLDERSSSPVQLSKFLGRDKDDGVRRSAVSGKKILLKLEKSKEDKEAESKRNELLKFLNASFD